jgi:hypothetical protein
MDVKISFGLFRRLGASTAERAFPGVFGRVLSLFALVFFSGAGFVSAEEALRGKVVVVLERPWETEKTAVNTAAAGGTARKAAYKPLSPEEAEAGALLQADEFFRGMIYGWNFDYAVADSYRKKPKKFDWEAVVKTPLERSRLSILKSDEEVTRDGNLFSAWVDYSPDSTQASYRSAWMRGQLRKYGSRGEASLFEDEGAAIKNAAENAVRSLLQEREAERPARVKGRIALAEFPVFSVKGASLSVRAIFAIEFTEIEKRFY